MARMGEKDCYFVSLIEELEAKRDYMAKFLTDVGMKVTIPEGGYFMVADWSPLGDTKICNDSDNLNLISFRIQG